MTSWLYDLRLQADVICFVLFRVWTIHVMKAEDIEQLREVGYFSLVAWNAFNFKNRLFARTFLLILRHGWFARKILVTPSDPAAFLNWCVNRGVTASTLPH